MVNHGPSQGCRTCRNRKVKCDTRKPFCSRCARSGLTCEGYPNVTNRNQSSDRGISNQPLRPKAPSPASDYDAVGYFLSGVLPQLPNYWPELLSPLLTEDSTPDLLRQAARAVAYGYASLDPRFSHFKYSAIEEYSKTTQTVHQLVSQPDCVYDDHIILILFIFLLWEHSRTMALEPSAQAVHTSALMNVLQYRSLYAFESTLSRTLLKKLCTYVVGDSMANADPEALRLLQLEVDGSLTASLLAHDEDDLCSLSYAASSVPQLIANGQRILSKTSSTLFSFEEASNFLRQAESEEGRLIDWASSRNLQGPVKSFPIASSSSSSVVDSYPKRIDAYTSITRASSCNSWRLIKCRIQAMQAQVLRLMAFHAAYEHSLNHLKGAIHYEDSIREVIDDICASVPYYLNPNDVETVAQRFPHRPGTLPVPLEIGPELIASVSQMISPILKASSFDLAPRSQRQWLQGYLTLLSKDSAGTMGMAMRLELQNSPIR